MNFIKDLFKIIGGSILVASGIVGALVLFVLALVIHLLPLLILCGTLIYIFK